MHIDKIYSAGLVAELKNYSCGYSATNHRILRLYNRLMRTGHPFIAQRLADKYPEAINIKSDVVMAFGMSLMAQEKLKGL